MLKLHLPKSVVAETTEDELKLYLALILFREQKITAGNAAKLAGLPLADFLYEIGRHKESFTNLTPEELKKIECPLF